MSDFVGGSHKGFAFSRQAHPLDTAQPLLSLVIGVALVGGICALSLIGGLLTGLFGTSWL